MADELEALVAEAYAAAVDPAMLGEWTARAGRWLGVPTAALAVIDREAGTLAWQHIVHPDPPRLNEYVERQLYLIDPQLPVVAALDRSRLYHGAEVMNPDRPETRAYLAFMSDRAGLGHYATAAMPINGGRHVATLTGHNALADGALDGEQYRRLAALAPAVSRTMALAVTHGDRLDRAYWDGRLADEARPTALLDGVGRLLRATRSMVAVLRSGDGLGERDWRLVAAEPASDARLQAVLGRAAAERGGRAEATPVARPSGRSPFILTAWPLAPAVRHLVPERAAVLVTLVDPAAAVPIRAELWRQAFGLTRREGQVVALLAEGHSPESAAAVLEMSVATARVHVRRLLSKTGTTRQSELIRLLLRVG